MGGLTLALAALSTGCAQDLSVHARVGPTPFVGQATNVPPATGGVTVAGPITVERIVLVLRRLRLESSPTEGDDASPGRMWLYTLPHRLELSGPALQPSALTDVVIGAFGGLHSFYEIDADLQPVTAEDAALAPELSPLVGSSLVVSGHYRGAPFTFTSDLTAVLKAQAVLRIGTNHNNIDLNLATNFWFLDPAGAVLDPNDPANRSAIEKNIVQSVSAFEDDNLDGIPDPLG